DPNIQEQEKRSRKLLGLDVKFRTFTPEEEDSYLISSERKKAFENIDTTTNPRKPKIEQKKGIVSELIKDEIIPQEIVKNYPLIYLGSGTDIEYPLAIGGRHIEMVDYIFESPET